MPPPLIGLPVVDLMNLPRFLLVLLTVLAGVTCRASDVLAMAKDQSPLPAAITSTQLPTDQELEDSWARVALRANPGPYQYLAYEVTMRGNAGVVSNVRGFMGRSDVISKTDLIRKEDVRRLFGFLRDQGLLGMRLPEAPTPTASSGNAKRKQVAVIPPFDPNNPHLGPARSTVPVFDLSFRLGGREATVLVADPFSHADRRFATLINVVRQVTLAVSGDIAYQPPTGTMGTQGYIFIDSVPSAEVSIDGVAIGESTPVISWTIASGSHVITLENKRLGVKAETKVWVQSGRTTSVELVLP